MLSSNFTLRLSRSHVLSSSKPLQKMSNLSSIQLHKLPTQTIIPRWTPQSNNTLSTLDLRRRNGERTLNKTKSLPQGKQTRAPQPTGPSTAKQTPNTHDPRHQHTNSRAENVLKRPAPRPQLIPRARHPQVVKRVPGEHDGDDLGLRSLCSP